MIGRLDKLLPPRDELDRDGLQAVIELAAWAHSEWVRIHPFGNGNGRTARILTNAILMRYGLPPVLRLRPRPRSPYGRAGAAGMDGDPTVMESLLRRLLKDFPINVSLQVLHHRETLVPLLLPVVSNQRRLRLHRRRECTKNPPIVEAQGGPRYENVVAKLRWFIAKPNRASSHYLLLEVRFTWRRG